MYSIVTAVSMLMLIDTIIDHSCTDCQALLVDNLRMETFGEVVRRERTARGWSQQHLANEAGLNRSHVTTIEGGKIGMPQFDTVQSIAKAFGMLPRELIEPTGQTIMEARGATGTADVESDELLQLYNRLPDDDRDRLNAIARALYQLSRDRS